MLGMDSRLSKKKMPKWDTILFTVLFSWLLMPYMLGYIIKEIQCDS